MVAGAACDGPPFDTTGVGAGSAGRGRGNGGEDVTRWWLGLLPVTWLSQLVRSCAISDSGDPLSAGADCGAWARTAAAVNGKNDRASVAAPIAFTRTTVPVR